MNPPQIVDHTETGEDTLNVEKLHCSLPWPQKPASFLWKLPSQVCSAFSLKKEDR